MVAVLSSLTGHKTGSVIQFMRHTLSVTSGATAQKRAPVQVGWLLRDPRAGVIFDPPRPCHSKSGDAALPAFHTPAHAALASRFFEVVCPFDLHLQLRRDKDGKFSLGNLQGERSPIRLSILQQFLKVTPRAEWRFPDRPTLQLQLPYVFVADDPVHLIQTAPFLSYNPKPWPGTIFAGRFPIDVWPRPVMWAFEWQDVEEPLIINRGDPLFYVQFETTPQDSPVELVQAELTPALDAYLTHIAGAVNFTDQTYGLFEKAAKARPKRLLQAVSVAE